MLHSAQQRRSAYLALAVLFLLRAVWIPAHLAMEPHCLPLAPATAGDHAAHGHAHGHSHPHSHPHTHDVAAIDPDDGGDVPEPSPHEPHPASDHLLGLWIVPGAESSGGGDEIDAVLRDPGLGFEPTLAIGCARVSSASARERPPPLRPLTRAPPAA